MADAAKDAGDAAFRNGNFQEAVEKYSQAIRDNAASGTNPKHVLLSNRSAAYAKLGNWDKSLEDAVACIAASPTFVKGWTRKGAALFEKGKYNEAAEAYRKALRLEPENASAKQQLARAEAMLGSTSSSSSSTSASTSSSSSKTSSSMLQIPVLLLQLFAIYNAVTFVLIQGKPEARITFSRCAFAMMLATLGETVFAYGLPDMTTFRNAWKALRGTASPNDLRGMSRVAMDENTHNIFFCSLLLSATPSILFLVPLVPMTLVHACNRVKSLTRGYAWSATLDQALLNRVVAMEPTFKRVGANSEVLMMFVLVFELFTPRRNLLVLILYVQLMRIRYLVSHNCKTAWAATASTADKIFLHARSPAAVQNLYSRLKQLIVTYGIPKK
eukprot:767610-Hanusia_phi.AAC.1